MPEGYRVVVQGPAVVPTFSELFYTQVAVNDKVNLRGMMDSGSMACTMSEEAEKSLREAGALVSGPQSAERIVLVGCGGKQTHPKCIYDLTLTVHGVKCIVPVLVVSGQRDELIIGSNVLKYLMRVMKHSDDYCKLVSVGSKHSLLDYEHFLDIMSCTTRWRGEEVPDKIGTVKLPRAVTLLPQCEHLVWGRLPSNVPVSPGSTIIMEPCTSGSGPRDVLVVRLITSMWDDRWVPLKMTNLSSKPLILKRNSRVAVVSSCLAVEDLDFLPDSCKMACMAQVADPCPMGNGGTEWFNRTLGNMLRALPLRAKQEWPQQIQTLTFAYNATVHETTGYVPFYLMFGRVPRLPVDIMFKSVLHDPIVVDFNSYSKLLLSYLSEAAKIAQEHTSNEQEHQARQYNKKIKGVSLNVGDRVLLANKGERGKKKLADKWEPQVYTVVERHPRTHIYRISDSSGQSKVVHRNLLLDMSFLPVQDSLRSQSLDLFSSEGDLSACGDLEDPSSLETESTAARTSLWVLSDLSHGVDVDSVAGEHAPQSADRQHGSCDGADVDSALPDSQTCMTHTSASPSGQAQHFALPTPVDCSATSDVTQSGAVSAPGACHGDAVVPETFPVSGSDMNQTSGQPYPGQPSNLPRHDPDRANVRGRVVTRAGRVVKSVNRLIENMVQKPITWGLLPPREARPLK
ncbi:unnamed protein product [Oreochromis niloticus]|nr:unnamed protein product [Mustela putorius furo]